ncbi:DNA-directed RNA polymerase subunit omega [Nesterenkonia sp. NBAIMH1]|uniref:DNA-directed RNA polymerase subunit omega n=1 Tax=Nesterenkonia sp. NBAIMH1 TaxID=2600320 RepID=UPI0011B81332|nr:DNA-directed RNA polymerase subunit omega [Nesterenkonia sp. NBAIMH1]
MNQLEGIIDPPIDELVAKADSKYALVLFGSKRARQINNYYAQLHEGLFEHIGPLVETKLNEKPLSIALREVHEDLLVMRPRTADDEAAAFSAPQAEFVEAGGEEG